MKIECDGRVLAAAAIAAPVGVVAAFNRYQKQYVIPESEVHEPFPGDDLVAEEGASTTTMAIEIDAPPSAVWPHLNQLGQDKAGFYSFSIFERAVHFLIHNTYVPQARWQHTKVGDWCFYGQQGIGHEIVMHEPGRYIVGVSDSRKPPTQEGAIAWVPAGMSDFAWSWGWCSGVMQTRLLQVIKACAEGRWFLKI
ncbi:hypothetical protein [Propioniciclava flava]